ncbi:hypothetical protein F441_13132 [Phytophthora nicotianae CJ01A1]|uniref:Uncharacterized protein n=2 Tax=Phytophthora nicotianae TaxID=4792 RepID=W2KSZ2_PHYNI|nr:hypothetical protein L916_12776 [Phytophthora nicotianae]ETL88293.1 hypothetical protein L917_12622 [Phytophthora nicotianae]ETP11348.1 hypothetical protein F441_13132 [Phytophthora nicotianae CJ01A1]
MTTVKLKRFTKKRSKKQKTPTKPRTRQILRPLDDEFVWPSLDEIRSAQRQHQAPVGSTQDADKVLRVDQRI